MTHWPWGEDINNRYPTDLSDREWGQGCPVIQISKPAGRREEARHGANPAGFRLHTRNWR